MLQVWKVIGNKDWERPTPPLDQLIKIRTKNARIVQDCSIPASFREGVKILTPPPLFQDFLGVGGLDPLCHNLLQKDWIFFLNFIFQGHFGICWLKLHVLEHYTMNYGVKKDHFVMRRGCGSPVSVTPEWSHCWNWCPDPLPQPLYL